MRKCKIKNDGASYFPIKGMTREERKLLLDTDFKDESNHVIVMLSQWMNQIWDVSFNEYAAQWCEAHPTMKIPIMRDVFPLKCRRKIKTNCSTYNP